MKRLLFLLALLACLISAAVAEDLNYMWGIPFGISLDDAANQFTEATGYELSFVKLENEYKKTISAHDVLIKGETFSVEFSGPINGNPEDKTYTLEHIGIEKDMFIDEKGILKAANGQPINHEDGIYGLLTDLTDMLSQSFGAPDHCGIRISTGSGLSMKFLIYDIPQADGKINDSVMSDIMSKFGELSVNYSWKNIGASMGISKTGFIRISIGANTSTGTIFDLPNVEYKGAYDPSNIGITSF